jgi:cytochrome c oxidase subunit II
MINRFLGLPEDASQHGASLDFFLELCHWFVLILFVGWSIYFIYTLIRFRKSRNPKADYVGVTSHYSTYLETSVVLIETVLLLAFAFPLWAKRVAELPSEKDSTVIRVVAQQFAWNIHYPGTDGKFGRRDAKLVSEDNAIGLDATDPDAKDDVVTMNQMHVPVNKPVILQISSKDVIHSVALKTLRITQDAIPGMNIPAWFTPVKTTKELQEVMLKKSALNPFRVERLPVGYLPVKDYLGNDGQPILKVGVPISAEDAPKLKMAGITEVVAAPEHPMEITCAQLCGNFHFRMKGAVTVETQEEFDQWFKSQAPFVQ